VREQTGLACGGSSRDENLGKLRILSPLVGGRQRSTKRRLKGVKRGAFALQGKLLGGETRGGGEIGILLSQRSIKEFATEGEDTQKNWPM